MFWKSGVSAEVIIYWLVLNPGLRPIRTQDFTGQVHWRTSGGFLGHSGMCSVFELGLRYIKFQYFTRRGCFGSQVPPQKWSAFNLSWNLGCIESRLRVVQWSPFGELLGTMDPSRDVLDTRCSLRIGSETSLAIYQNSGYHKSTSLNISSRI